jgi:hypothetical protein
VPKENLTRHYFPGIDFSRQATLSIPTSLNGKLPRFVYLENGATVVYRRKHGPPLQYCTAEPLAKKSGLIGFVMASAGNIETLNQYFLR